MSPRRITLVSSQLLGFDAKLSRTDYLIIGWSADQADTLGAALFAVEAKGQPRQRVLAVRARQVSAGGNSDLPSLGSTSATSPAEAAPPSSWDARCS